MRQRRRDTSWTNAPPIIAADREFGDALIAGIEGGIRSGAFPPDVDPSGLAT